MREELQPVGLKMFLEAVNLDSPLVVDVYILLLGGGEKQFIMQEADVPRGLRNLRE